MQDTCKILPRSMQDFVWIIQQSCKIRARSMQDSWVAGKCNNGVQSCKILGRFLQELSKNLARSSKNCVRIIQDPNKIPPKSSNNSPRIIQESCKYYPRIMQQSCNINLRIMQDIMRCVKVAFICSANRFQKLVAKCVQGVHSVHVFLKLKLYNILYIFSFKQRLSIFQQGLGESQHHLRQRQKREKERTIYCTSVRTFFYYAKQSNIPTLVNK